jgi:hypothetical protein
MAQPQPGPQFLFRRPGAGRDFAQGVLTMSKTLTGWVVFITSA